MSYFFPFAGLSIAVAGGDKLTGDRGYDGMFRDLGWSRGNMQAAAVAELAGGLLMTRRGTRRLGGAMVATASMAILASELRLGNSQLAGPRGLVLLAGLAALVSPRR